MDEAGCDVRPRWDLMSINPFTTVPPLNFARLIVHFAAERLTLPRLDLQSGLPSIQAWQVSSHIAAVIHKYIHF